MFRTVSLPWYVNFLCLSCFRSMRCDTPVVKAHINAYFDYVYPMPSFSFLHRALFMLDYNQGTCSPGLLRAVCAAGSFYIPQKPETQSRKDVWINEAQSAVLQAIDEPCLVNIQSLLLLVFCNAMMRRHKKVMTLISIASRWAFISRLDQERSDLPFMIQEIRRRVMWGLCMQDQFYAGGLPKFTTCAMGTVSLKLPCSESAFAMDLDNETLEYLHQDSSSTRPSQLGIVAYWIKLMDIRNRVLRSVYFCPKQHFTKRDQV